jgi:hypothetical protein
MNTYNAYYDKRVIEVQAETLYQAKLKAVEVFKPTRNKHSLVSVLLAAKADTPVIHSIASL